MLGMVSMKTCHKKTKDMHCVKEYTTSEQLDLIKNIYVKDILSATTRWQYNAE